jgi:8-oxo-dGTP pyrophosphatase MutT (NUDIX family)
MGAEQGGMVLGGEKTSHDNGGVKYIVKQTGQRVELEGDEFVLCDDVIRSTKYYTLTGTPYEIILKLANEGSCKIGALSEIQGGEFVICKKVIRDKQVISVSGTPAEIVSQLQVEKGCNPHWSWELERQDGEACDVCEHDKKKMENGGDILEGKGDCIKASSDLLLFPDREFFGIPYVVHAECKGYGKLEGLRFGHAWVEDDYFVYDYANGQKVMFPKQRYYEAGDIKKAPKKYKRYTEQQLLAKVLKHDTYSFWDLDVKFEDGGQISSDKFTNHVAEKINEGDVQGYVSSHEVPQEKVEQPVKPETVEDVYMDLFVLLREYGSRKMGFVVAQKYISEIDPTLAKEFMAANGIKDWSEFGVYVDKLQTKARGGKGKERAERREQARKERGVVNLANIEKIALEQSDEMDRRLEERYGKMADGGSVSKLIAFYEPDSMMPMAADFGDGSLYQTSLPIFEKGGEIGNVLNLAANIDSLKMSDWLKEKYRDDLALIESYLAGDIDVLSSLSEDGYTSIILDNHDGNGRRSMLSIKAGMEFEPVPVGMWMNFWELDFQHYFKVSKTQYAQMSLKQRAELENKLQLKLWTKELFWMCYAAFYMPAIYLDWTWGKDAGYAKSIYKRGKYWSEYMQNEHPEKMAKGGTIQKPATKRELEERWDKKKDHIMQLASSLRKLRYNLSLDMKSDDEKTRLTALVIAIIDKTAERVGNEHSEEEGHYGVTGFRKEHIKINGNRVSLEYTGKSGVEHEKAFTDELIASVLRGVIKESPDDFVFTTSDGFKIKADRVNRYLEDYGISAKDLRGYYANKFIVKKLETSPASKDESEREKAFREAIKFAAEKVGHGAATLKNHYLIPELEKNYILHGRLIDLSGFYKTGGLVKMADGGIIEAEAFLEDKKFWGDTAAGALIYSRKTGRYLILQRSAEVNEPLTWNGISGGIDEGEDPREAIIREIAEETGFGGNVDLKLAYIFNADEEDFVFYNFVGVVDDEFEPELNWENSDHKWIGLHEIPEPVHFGLQELLAQVDIKKVVKEITNT